MKTVMLGIDAADLDFIEARLATLPGFRRALETGVLRRLRGHSALLSGSVWPTFYTGTPPGEHGIYHHLQWDRQRMRLRRVSADWLYCEPFWYGLSRRGCNVVVVDVPMSFPPRLGSVTEIVSWGSHDQLGPFSTNPRNLGGEILRQFGQHPMGCEIPVDKSNRELAQIRENLVEGASRKGALCRWLLGARPWQLFIAVFGECHRGGHILWPATSRRDLAPPDDALVSVYQAVDREVGAILASLDLNETKVIIFSLHGMGPNTSQEHFLPEVLVRANRHFGDLHPDGGGEHARSSRGFSIARYLRGNVPPGVQNAIARAVPVHVRDLVVNRSTTDGYDWNTTPAFALLADLHGYVRFNLKGREARGYFEPGDGAFQRYTVYLRDVLLGLRDAESGQCLVADVHLAAERFSGSRTSYLPDAIVNWSDARPASRLESTIVGPIEATLTTGRAGNHRPHGFCITLEPGSSRRAEGPPCDLTELAAMASAGLKLA
jgi:predicted AlkP superfamily phosphohydrolase/phosphomutase